VRDPRGIHRADVQGLAGLKYISVIKYTIEYMEERGGIRTPGTGFGQYNGLANWNVLGPVVWIQQLTSVREPVFGLK
jgi:hypothetical protein